MDTYCALICKNAAVKRFSAPLHQVSKSLELYWRYLLQLGNLEPWEHKSLGTWDLGNVGPREHGYIPGVKQQGLYSFLVALHTKYL